MAKTIPHNRPSLGLEEQVAAARVLESGWVSQGSAVAAFEEDLCRFFGLPDGHVVAVSSGSAALYLALWALEGAGRRVGLPVYSCAALRNAVGLIGGNSIYLDCANGGPNLDVIQANTSEIDILIAPSMFGIPIVFPPARNYSLIEDVAQALGAQFSGERIGLRGDLGVCSFFATKLITSGGQGGAVISRNKLIIDKIRDYREFDCRDDRKLRFNFQMTDLQAAVGRVQLRRLPALLNQREKWFSIYRGAGLDLIDGKTQCIEPVRYRVVVRCKEPKRMIGALEKINVSAIVPIYEHELLDAPSKHPIAKELSNTTVSLPAYPEMCEEDVVRISRVAEKAA